MNGFLPGRVPPRLARQSKVDKRKKEVSKSGASHPEDASLDPEESRDEGQHPKGEKDILSAAFSLFLCFCLLFLFSLTLKARISAYDGTSHQEAIIKAQKAQGFLANRKLGTELQGIETPHFIIFSDFSSQERKKQAETAEVLYHSFDNVFKITANRDKMWDGKCVLYLFTRKEDFLKFAKRYDYYDASQSGGYFRIEQGQVRVVLYHPPPGHPRSIEETLVHETAHVFLHFYRKVVAIPKWLDEGLAEYFRFEYNPKSPEKKHYMSVISSKVKKRDNRSAKKMMTRTNPSGPDDIEGYATAWSMVEFLLTYNKHRFVHFVKLVKEGMGQEEALRKSYGGWNYRKFEAAWRDYVTKEYT